MLTHNQLPYTKKCIESIRKNTSSLHYELIVVDNASNDGTLDYLNEQTDLRVISNQENVGYSKANNQGVKIAVGDVIVFLNNDTVVTQGWLQSLVSALYSKEKIAMVGPVTNNDNINGIQKIKVHYNQDTLEGLSEFSESHCAQHANRNKKVLRLVGFALACKKEVLNKIGLFDEAFGIGNFEDDDLCLRMLIKGYELRIVQDCFVHHFGSITFKNKDIDFAKLMENNKIVFKKKWGFDAHYFINPRLDLISLVPESISRILDIGCGMGAMALELMNQRSCEVVGIEKHNLAFHFAKQHLDQVFHEDIETIELSEEKLGTFDCIICADILQHLKDPWNIVKNLVKLLNENGYLIVSIPNVSNLEIIAGLLQGNFSYNTSEILNQKHLRFFTYTSLPFLFPQEMVIENVTSINTNVTERGIELLKELKALGEKYGLNTNQLKATTYKFIVKTRKRSH
ncbi:glycosyltransferase [Chengkuizengella sp. SCS-71B]|uniref:glycosyltransferase n=1 Tax=Chengkuizengella sp. SCS-71B TaxID=3115290 RepID=UPI0039B77B87